MSAELDFWSRRKAGVAAEAEAERKAVVEAEIAEQQAALEDKTDDEICAELDLPNPDTLKAGDDVSVFMKSAVPERLRRRALRTLWRSNPVFANVDGLVDYGDDFTNANCVIENLQTAYQVGKGMLEHVQKLAAEAEEKAQAEAPSEAAPEVEPATPAPVAAAETPAPNADDTTDAPALAEATPAPRRMQFSFPNPTPSQPESTPA